MDFQREVVRHVTKDDKGGEHTYERTFFKRRSKPKVPFAQMIFQDLGRLYDLQENQLKVFIKIVSNMDYDNIVRVSGYDRKAWSKDIGVTHQTFNVALSKLMACGLVLGLGGGAYQIDPEIFNMGDMSASLEKTNKYNASFRIEYQRNKDGIERRVKLLNIDCEDVDGE